MTQALPKGLVRQNLWLPDRREFNLDYLRLQTEAASDSEVTRQALRYFEQFVLDEKHGIHLTADNGVCKRKFSLEMFRDPPEGTEVYIRRSLVFHHRTMLRLERLCGVMSTKDISEVIRCALRYYKKLVESQAAQLYVTMPSGEELRIRIWPLSF